MKTYELTQTTTGRKRTVTVWGNGRVELIPADPIYREQEIHKAKNERAAVKWLLDEVRKTGHEVKEVAGV